MKESKSEGINLSILSVPTESHLVSDRSVSCFFFQNSANDGKVKF